MNSWDIFKKFYKGNMFINNKTNLSCAKSEDPTPTHRGWEEPSGQGAS